jgi:integral membrane protein
VTASTLPGEARAFKIVAYVEAVSYLLLLCASVVHRGFDGPDAVSVLGPIHGILFLVYVVLALKVRSGQGWGFWRTVGVILLSAVPFGGFWAGSHLQAPQGVSPRA